MSEVQISEEFFLKGLLASAQRFAYVAVPKDVLAYVLKYPADWLGIQVCGTLTGDQFAGGTVRDDRLQVDLWCTLDPGHEGEHGFARVLEMPVEGAR